VPLANERTNAVNDTTIGLDVTEAILTNEISDKALEAAAGTGREETAGNWTTMCTTLGGCPGGPVS